MADLQARGRKARNVPDVPAIVEILRREAADGDVVVVMSNGAFGGIHDRLLQVLRDRRTGRSAPGSDAIMTRSVKRPPRPIRE